ncbi:unnamed protein product [Adineta ricciae]|uniref:G-protein coupled receptors family 1 profile domain-containing protein n=1 Tax=Adineta ricciae TaxID=249248 RepID=A0A814VW99_ADIRI|nr:unnamed protein product [Adineta ricciae]CAF1233908.1 unnamed protein product [Adineta ricciae]
MTSTGTTLSILTYALNFVAVFVFFFIIILGVLCRRDMRDISLVLTYNTCFAALLTCLTVLIMNTSNLSSGFLTFNFDFCRVWGLIYDMCQCSIYHSFYLQAFYRLCRVIFYKKKSLLSYSLFISLVFAQWTLTIVILLPPFFLGWYTPLPTEQYCLIPYSDYGAELYHVMVLYVIPIVCISTTYISITRYIRKSSRRPTTMLAINQQQRNLRDLTVMRRILVLISVLIALRGPTIIFMVYAVIRGQMYEYTFGIVGLVAALCMIFMGLMLIHITPQLRKNRLVSIIYHDNRANTRQTGPQCLTLPSTTGGATGLRQQTKSPRIRKTPTHE